MCTTDVNIYEQYATPIKSGIPGGRRLRKSKRGEQEQKVIGMERKKQQNLRKLMDVVQIKYVLYGSSQILL